MYNNIYNKKYKIGYCTKIHGVRTLDTLQKLTDVKEAARQRLGGIIPSKEETKSCHLRIKKKISVLNIISKFCVVGEHLYFSLQIYFKCGFC